MKHVEDGWLASLNVHLKHKR